MTNREFEARQTEIRGEFAQLRGELRGAVGELRGEIGEIRGEIAAINRRLDDLPTLTKMRVANVTTMLGFGGFVLAAVRVG